MESPFKNIKSIFSKGRNESNLENNNISTNINKNEDNIILAIDGNYEFDWNIKGMDCPDCAMKASKAVKRLPGIQECSVSATEGRISITLDTSRGNVSRTSSVLEKLGHPADIGWVTISNLSALQIENKVGIKGSKLTDSISNVIGVLSSRIKKGRIELQLLDISDPNIKLAQKKGLEYFFDENY